VSGALLTGVFATKSVNPAGANGLLYGNASLLWAQLVSVLAAAALAVLGSTVILLFLKATIGLRPTEEDEMLGLDWTEHAESAYTLQGAYAVQEATAARVVVAQESIEDRPEPKLVTA